MRDEMTAQQNARDLADQSVATPAQQIVMEYHHHHQQPIYIPTPQVPQQPPIHIHTPQQDYSEMMRQFGMTMQQAFLAQQQQAPTLNTFNNTLSTFSNTLHLNLGIQEMRFQFDITQEVVDHHQHLEEDERW